MTHRFSNPRRVRNVRRTHHIRAVNIVKAIVTGVDAGIYSLTVARDAMDSLAVCPESVRTEEVL